MNRPDWTRRFTAVSVVSVVAMALLVALIVILVTSWNWVSGSESGSTTIRNVGLVAGGVLALWLAFWPSKIADRQADTAQQGLLNERYQKGAEMLGSGVLSVRLGGIYALQRLAEEHPAQYHVQIMRLLCEFVRNPTKEDDDETRLDGEEQSNRTTSSPRVREDVQAVMTAIGTRGEAGLALEKKLDFALDLHGAALAGVFLPIGANLSGALLFNADLSSRLDADTPSRTTLAEVNLSNAKLMRAKLMGAGLFGAKLIEADLSGAKLTGATLTLADFSRAVLFEANLSGALLFDAENVTQEQLDRACADPDNPPRLVESIADAETGEPLVWSGKSCRDT